MRVMTRRRSVGRCRRSTSHPLTGRCAPRNEACYPLLHSQSFSLSKGSRSPLVVKDDVPSHRLSIPSPQYEEEEDALTPAQGGLRIDLPTALLDFANAMVESGEPDTIFEGKVKIAHDRQCVVCAKIYKAGDDMCKMNVDVVLEIREHPITPP